MLTAGTYNAIARGGQLSESKNKGTPQVVVQFEVCDAEFAGQTITWTGFFTEKTEDRTLEALRIAGWRGDDITDLSDLSREDVPVVQLVVEEETYEGKVYSRVRWVNKAGGGLNVKPLDAKRAATFASRMKAKVRAFDAKAGATAPAPVQPRPSGSGRRAAPAPAGPAEEDIPF